MDAPAADTLATVAAGRTAAVVQLRDLAERLELPDAAEVLVLLETLSDEPRGVEMHRAEGWWGEGQIPLVVRSISFAQRKTEVVLRVIRGEALDGVAREIQVPVHEVEEWRRVFLESGRQGLKRRGLDPEERELRRSSVYALAAVARPEPPPAKRGPKTAQSDAEIVGLILASLRGRTLTDEQYDVYVPR